VIPNDRVTMTATSSIPLAPPEVDNDDHAPYLDENGSYHITVCMQVTGFLVTYALFCVSVAISLQHLPGIHISYADPQGSVLPAADVPLQRQLNYSSWFCRNQPFAALGYPKVQWTYAPWTPLGPRPAGPQETTNAAAAADVPPAPFLNATDGRVYGTLPPTRPQTWILQVDCAPLYLAGRQCIVQVYPPSPHSAPFNATEDRITLEENWDQPPPPPPTPPPRNWARRPEDAVYHLVQALFLVVVLIVMVILLFAGAALVGCFAAQCVWNYHVGTDSG
jgi:hypothetical protein